MLSNLHELFRYRELFVNLVARDLKARYKRSVLGFFWSLLNPLVQVATLTIVFKMVMKFPIKNYAPFVFAAFLPWTFFQLAIMDASTSIIMNARLLKRVYFPREIIPLAHVASNLIHFLLAMLVLFAYLAHVGIIFAWDQLIYLPVIILLQTLLVSGVALAISCASVYFNDIQYLLTVGLNLLFYSSCIFYSLENLETSRFAFVAHLNPLVPLVTLYRQALLPCAEVPDGGPVQVRLIWHVFLFAIVVFLAGYTLFNARKWEFAERT